MNVQIGLNLRPNHEFDLTIDPIGKYCEPKSPWNIECENNEATFIKVDISIIHYTRLKEYFSLLLSKLRLGGKLIISGINLNEVNRLFYMGDLSEDQFNNIIYPNYPNLNQASLYTPSFIREIINGFGLKITGTKLDNITYYIEAVRENIM